MTDIRDLLKKRCTDEEFQRAQDQFWKSICRQTGLTDEQLARFNAASNHPYECQCELCQEWWSLMPREEDE